MKKIKQYIYKSYLIASLIFILGWFFVINQDIEGRYYNNSFYFIYGTLFIIYLFGGILIYTIDSLIMFFSNKKTTSYLLEQKIFLIGLLSFFVIIIIANILSANTNDNITINSLLFLTLLITNVLTYYKVRILKNQNNLDIS